MDLLITGDLYIGDSFKCKELFDKSFVEFFHNVDYRIVNLEAPITTPDPKNKIVKTGRHLCSSAGTIIPYLNLLKVNIVTLANNHIMDYGRKGLSDTIFSLTENEINYVGAGEHLHEAQRPITIEKEGLRIAILNFTENEWSIANEGMAGANPLDIIDNVNQIIEAKRSHDKVLCIIHGGHEYYHLPTPRMVKQYHFYADNGADVIVGHHPHCIGGYEIYKGVPIFYSVGNFLFTLPSKHEEWYTGLIIKLKLFKSRDVVFEVIPIQQEKKTFTVKLCSQSERDKIKVDISNYSALILDKKSLHKSYREFIAIKGKDYLNVFSPVNFFSNKYLSGLSKQFGMDLWLLHKNHRRLLLNILRCETHYDGSKSILESKINGD